MGQLEKYGVFSLTVLVLVLLAFALAGPRAAGNRETTRSRSAARRVVPVTAGRHVPRPAARSRRRDFPFGEPPVVVPEKDGTRGGPRGPAPGRPEGAGVAVRLPVRGSVPAPPAARDRGVPAANLPSPSAGPQTSLAAPRRGESKTPRAPSTAGGGAPSTAGGGAAPGSARSASKNGEPKHGEPKKIPPETAASPFVLHTIAKGENLMLLAKQFYGSSTNWKRILDANPGLDPKRLPIGMTIRIPNPREAAVRAPSDTEGTGSHAEAGAAGSTYRVRPGDTLTKIAGKQLGSTSRWREIHRLNRDVIPDPEKLVVGLEIQLPAR